ncbi:hypothetical protein QBC32DRAFT_125462 [Pseudoneurospora amorphoporcata]|uniref:Uncharacterized protein n=1 Tax=Pseudoneurospora amorphoporcata TaxID=241081 RepID=A0AAN6SH82_9PEZI|nr:hypothetical protein QBC32DRAFT_125462 [Pseudoneurospora amorphoporcata]
MFRYLLFPSCVHFFPSKPGHSGTRGHEFDSLQATRRIYTARANTFHTVLYVQGVHILERRRILHTRPDPWTLASQQILPCVRANRCTLVAMFEDRCRSGKDEEHGSSGECHEHARRPTRLVIDHRTPAVMLASSIASHWCRGGHVGPDPGTSASFLRVASVEACRAGPGSVLFRNVGFCNQYSQWEFLTQQSKGHWEKICFLIRSGQAGLACSRFFEEGGLTGCRWPWNRAEGNCMGWTLATVSL